MTTTKEDLILDKLDKLENHQLEMTSALVRNTVSLEEHARRCDLLETEQAILRAELKPVQKYVDQFEMLLKAVGGLSILAGAGAAVLKIFEFIRNLH